MFLPFSFYLGLDLNFMSDRAAAREVIQAEVQTTIVPIQSCAQVVMGEDFLRRDVDAKMFLIISS